MDNPARTTYAAGITAYMHDGHINGVSLGALGAVVGVGKLRVSGLRHRPIVGAPWLGGASHLGCRCE